jgi:hypothetical protein
MPADGIDELVERFGSLEAKVSAIATHIGHDGPRPDDPLKADRWNVPLYWHVSDLRDSIHALRNSLQVLFGIIERLSAKLDHNANLSRDNSESLVRLAGTAERLELSSARIEENIGVYVREKPLLLRDLHRVDTNATEMTLIALLFLETAVFLAETEALLRSAMFVAMSQISATPLFWGLLCGVLGVGSFAAFLSRSRRYRLTMAAFNTVHFGVTGGLTMALQPGVMGWVMHVIAFGLAFWVCVRGPARAL